MSLDKLFGSFMAHENTLKNSESDESKKKREISFKISSSQTNEEIKYDKDSDEKIVLFTKRFNKMFKKDQFP